MSVGAIDLDSHKRSLVSEIADPCVRLGERYVVPGTHSNISTNAKREFKIQGED